jgi:hypothetical protein
MEPIQLIVASMLTPVELASFVRVCTGTHRAIRQYPLDLCDPSIQPLECNQLVSWFPNGGYWKIVGVRVHPSWRMGSPATNEQRLPYMPIRRIEVAGFWDLPILPTLLLLSELTVQCHNTALVDHADETQFNFGQFPALTILNVREQFWLPAVPALDNASTLERLVLYDCPALKKLHPGTVCPSLTHLTIDTCWGFTDKSIVSLSNLPAIQRLRFRNCRLRASPIVTNNVHLTHLDLDGCDIADITSLNGNGTITRLGLHGLCDGTNLEPLASMRELRVLDLSSRIVPPHRAVDLDITILGSCHQLISLDLSGRLVYDLSPLVGCRELQELHTIHCQYIGPMDCMRQCPRLYVLTMIWSYASGHVSADRCVHFTTADRSSFARRTLNNHERRLRKLLRRWGHFTKIEGMTAVADFLLAKQRWRGQYYRGREKVREVNRQRERGHGRPLTVEYLSPECTVADEASDATADFNECDASGRNPTFMHMDAARHIRPLTFANCADESEQTVCFDDDSGQRHVFDYASSLLCNL